MEPSDIAIEIERYLAVKGFESSKMTVSELIEELYSDELEEL